MKLIRSLAVLTTIAVASPAFAAIPKKNIGDQWRTKQKHSSKKTKTSKKRKAESELNLTIMALRLPIANRMQALSRRGGRSYRSLQTLMFDSGQSLQVRWRAITAMGRLFPKKAKVDLQKAMDSKEWYMRNAALLASVHGNRQQAIDWAEKALTDKALVVRTAAVQVIEKMNAQELRPLLWKELYSKRNFRAGQSLWVRKHIVRALAKSPQKMEKVRYLRLLKEQDAAIHPYAMAALSKVTGKNPAKKFRGTAEQRRAWLQWSIDAQVM